MELELLQGAKVLITGATGLIGKSLINEILKYNNEIGQTPIKIIAVIRNKEKAIKCFGNNSSHISFIEGDIRTVNLLGIKADYIIHAASQTSSKLFINEPINTIEVAIDGTRHLLNYAKTCNVKKFIFLSTMEVYGTPQSDEKIKENYGTDLDTMNVRSCYPESKRMCECLCASYAAEFGISFNVLRLTQTFGPGVEYGDGRVFADFARCVIEKRDIILKTKGETKRCYLYTDDAVNAILTVLLNAESGQVYNVANEETYCSIYEMAELVAKEVSNGTIDVRIELDEAASFGFAPTLHMNLDMAKIRSLGWKPKIGLEQMYRNMIEYMKKSKIDCQSVGCRNKDKGVY